MDKKKFKLSEYKSEIKDWSVFEKIGYPTLVKAKCMDCCCYDRTEVKLCPARGCPLWLTKERLFNKNKENIQ